MTKRFLGIAAGVVLAAGSLPAQIGGGFGAGAGGGGGRGGAGGGGSAAEFLQQAATLAGEVTFRATTGGGAVVVARPFSAVEERKSVQKLTDGLEISNVDSKTIYRDSQGRTRVETVATNTISGAKIVTIQIADPVARVNISLNPDAKSARRSPIIGDGIPISFGTGVRDTAVGTRLLTNGAAPVAAARGGGGGGGVAVAGAISGGRGGRGYGNQPVVEDLGAQSVNGVVATGTRRTLTIPQGSIGNNRDIHVVNERWYSEDLQMLVKSVNTDPRFGEDTYELLNISRTEPDPTLFQVPAGYTVMEVGGGRGGRGGAVQPGTAPPQQGQGGGGGGAQDFQVIVHDVIK